MGLRFYRRVHFPGGSVNLSKSGASLSLGCRGAHLTLGNGGIRTTVGIPGTGIFWTDKVGRHTGVHSGPSMTFRKAVEIISSDQSQKLLAERDAAYLTSLTPAQRFAVISGRRGWKWIWGTIGCSALVALPYCKITGKDLSTDWGAIPWITGAFISGVYNLRQFFRSDKNRIWTTSSSAPHSND